MFRSVIGVDGCVIYGRGRKRHHTWPSWILTRSLKVCEGLYSGVEMRVVMNRAKSRRFGVARGLRQGYPLSPLFNIYMTGMEEGWKELS